MQKTAGPVAHGIPRATARAVNPSGGASVLTSRVFNRQDTRMRSLLTTDGQADFAGVWFRQEKPLHFRAGPAGSAGAAATSAVRRDIFVEPQPEKIPAPSGRHIPTLADDAAPTELDSFCTVIYKDTSPDGLGNSCQFVKFASKKNSASLQISPPPQGIPSGSNPRRRVGNRPSHRNSLIPAFHPRVFWQFFPVARLKRRPFAKSVKPSTSFGE